MICELLRDRTPHVKRGVHTVVQVKRILKSTGSYGKSVFEVKKTFYFDILATFFNTRHQSISSSIIQYTLYIVFKNIKFFYDVR